MRPGIATSLLLFVLGPADLTDRSAFASAAEDPPARYVASPEPGWPQWRGPRRDGICSETGLLESWPEGGPKPIWSASGIGRGYSSPVIGGGRIFLSGDFEDRLEVVALDLQGQTVWRATNGLPWKGPYPGARGCCALSDGRVFHVNAHGRVVCLDVTTGREHWSANPVEQFGGKNLTWALSECLLLDGSRVIVTTGGPQTLMVALDARSGEVRWKTEPLLLGPSPDRAHQRVEKPVGEADSAGYASPILVELAARRQIVGCSLRHVFGVDADSGKLLWTRPMPTTYSVIAATPVLVGNAVFVTAPDAGGGKLHRVRATGTSVEVETVWTTLLDSCQGGVVAVGDSLFGSWYRARKGWARIDAQTGSLRYEVKQMPMGPLLFAEGLLYWLSQEGEMTLLQPGGSEFLFKGRFRLVPDKVNDAWTHPVIYDRKLYLRYHDQLVCYDIRRR